MISWSMLHLIDVLLIDVDTVSLSFVNFLSGFRGVCEFRLFYWIYLPMQSKCDGTLRVLSFLAKSTSFSV